MLTARGAGFEEANGALNNTVTFFVPLGDQGACRYGVANLSSRLGVARKQPSSMGLPVA